MTETTIKIRKKRVLTKVQKRAAKLRWRKWAKKNRERLNAHVRAYRARRYAEDGFWRESGPKAVALKNWYEKEKSSPCKDCGNCFDACCMDFDHRDGEKKKYCVGTMVAHHYSMELITIEVAKCDLVCANCHRIRTRNRLLGSGKNAIMEAA